VQDLGEVQTMLAERVIEWTQQWKGTIRLKARIVFTLKVVIMLWWAFGVTHRPT
jgi:hypothetical protein